MTTSGSLFASAIEHHLELKRRNRHLDDNLPLQGDVFRYEDTRHTPSAELAF